MQVVTTAHELRAMLNAMSISGQRVGFVPTMGALHEGHASLVRRSAADCQLTVASIFVNPSQFNDPADLERYPRTPEADRKLLAQNGCDLLYQPATTDVYSEDFVDPTVQLNFSPLDEVMEAAHRPGHFAGVASVVYRLLEIVEPDVLFLGQKDYQQVAIVRSLVRQLRLDTRVVSVPTVREADGLALSSRNRLLGPAQRTAAAAINRHLTAVAAGLRAGWPPRQLERLALDGMAANPALEPEYVSVFNGFDLQPWSPGQDFSELVVATAVRVGTVRLIDNHVALAGA